MNARIGAYLFDTKQHSDPTYMGPKRKVQHLQGCIEEGLCFLYDADLYFS